jgi:MFS family permease
LAVVALQGGSTLSAIVGGQMLIRYTRYKRVPLIGLLFSIAGLAPLVVAPTGFSPAATLTLLTVVGFGLGPMFPFTVVVVQNAVELHELGIATSAMNFFRALGGAFIVALFGAILVAGAPALGGMAIGPAAGAGEGSESFRFVFAAAVLCLGIALASILALEERPLRGSDTARGVV